VGFVKEEGGTEPPRICFCFVFFFIGKENF